MLNYLDELHLNFQLADARMLRELPKPEDFRIGRQYNIDVTLKTSEIYELILYTKIDF